MNAWSESWMGSPEGLLYNAPFKRRLCHVIHVLLSFLVSRGLGVKITILMDTRFPLNIVPGEDARRGHPYSHEQNEVLEEA